MEADLNVILGGVGMGKSYLANALASMNRRNIIVDPMKEYEGDVIFPSLPDFISAAKAGFLDGLRKLTVVCRGMLYWNDDTDLLFQYLAQCRRFHIVIDEIDKFCSPQSIPLSLGELLNYRRHYGISLTVVARRAAKIHKDVTALASTIFLFRMHAKVDLQFVREEVGDDYAEACRRLKPKHHIRIPLPPENI